MRRIPGILGTALLACAMGACAAVSGLSAYTSSDCPGGCDASVDGSLSADGTTDTGGNDSMGNTDAGEDGATGDGGCVNGRVACDGGCVDVTSVSNCGSCGNVCGGSTPACAPVNGVYSCVATCPPSTPTDCSGTCVDTTSNANDCSACASTCSTSVANAAPACVTSACTFRCNNGYVPCSGACVDEQTDNNNCGGCGSTHACTAGQTCTSGVCSDAGAGCDIACPTSTATTASCPTGGCNTANAACPAAGQGCFCTKDSHCKSGKCVKTTGQNDVSCGTNCTGAGAADGFDCQLVANGIPSSCRLGFGYTPSHFNPATPTPAPTATFNCGTTTFDSTGAGTWGNPCGQSVPAAVSVTQSGGPNAMVLAFQGLSITSGATLRLTGPLPVILAVYGNATIAGNINADGASGAANSTTAGASGPGGNYNCGASTGGSPPNSNNNNGGGGGGASGAGGKGAADSDGNVGGTGGVLRANASIAPLYGGCPGGNSGSCGHTQSGGGGGGAVQISAAGTLSVTGTISAQGGAGGSGAAGSGCGSTGQTGGAGGGSGGAILLEGQGAPSTGTVNGGSGGRAGQAGGTGGTSGTPTGGNGITDSPPPGTKSGSGGGGGYGYLKTNQGSAPGYTCPTTLSPAPACNAAHTACLCVADSDCSSGKCLNMSNQCTGACTGSGVADSVDCESLTSAATAWSCSIGNCDDVTSPSGTCSAAGVACWCTSDAQCSGGKCVTWAGCAAGACTGSGTPNGFHCFP